MNTSVETTYVEIADKSKIMTVIGADSYFGAHMVKHLSQTDLMIYGFSQDSDFDFNLDPIVQTGLDKISYAPAPIISDAIIICIDPCIGFDKYITKIKRICEQCLDKNFYGKICYFSSGAICSSWYEAISEERVVSPRTELDLALATGENLLNVLLYNPKNEAMPIIMRIGTPYGDEIGMKNTPGFVNQLLEEAAQKHSLEIPFLSQAKRSLTHIADICESAIQLIHHSLGPMVVNVPGEVLTIEDVASTISTHYGVEVYKNGSTTDDNQDYYVGDQHLSEGYFNESVRFSRQYAFAKWLTTQRISI